jgi:SnoaL-like domain
MSLPMSLPNTHPNIEILRTIYADLTRIAEYADDDIVLHTADREIPGRATRVVGKEAVLAKELDLIRLTDDTLAMDVDDIIANDHFGAVLGILRVYLDDSESAMPFCGLWRFRNGRIIEHWENAYDAAALDHFLTEDSPKLVGDYMIDPLI